MAHKAYSQLSGEASALATLVVAGLGTPAGPPARRGKIIFSNF